MTRLVPLLATLASLAAPPALRAEVSLVMAEQMGCVYCTRWDREIAPIYCKTAEGQAAPLTRHDIRSGQDAPVDLERRIVFTPTFILARDGAEVARLEGYPGEDFFWALLARMLEEEAVAVAEIPGEASAECVLEATGEMPETDEARDGQGPTAQDDDGDSQ